MLLLYMLHALISCLVAYNYTACFPNFWHFHPNIFQHFNRNILLLFHCFFSVQYCVPACRYNAFCVHVSPTHFLLMVM